ncbi:hypothetical protein ACFL38_03535 [Candidatus Omnitrophota bacterium]
MARVNLSKIKTYSLKKRPSKVNKADFASVYKKRSTFKKLYQSLPHILAVADLRKVVKAVASAKKKGKPVIFMLGAHVIKCGLSPIIINLIKKQVIDAVAINGAGMIHDFEIAYAGKTSEDVDKAIQDGSFGMAEETAQFLNCAVAQGALRNAGIGEAVQKAVAGMKLPFKKLSIINATADAGIPLTVHVALGTDIIHQHPSCDGAALGKAGMKDFQIFIEQVSRIGNGGVVISFGSAVLLPEVFLKAVTVARNLGFSVKNFTTAYFDMIRHYRPSQNIVRRPTIDSGKGYYIVGHHEIMLPLLAAAIIEEL